MVSSFWVTVWVFLLYYTVRASCSLFEVKMAPPFLISFFTNDQVCLAKHKAFGAFTKVCIFLVSFPYSYSANMVRAALVTATSLALTGAVVAHAYFLKHQFYPTVVYLTKSSPSMAVSSSTSALLTSPLPHSIL